jgi:hypothetical protein
MKGHCQEEGLMARTTAKSLLTISALSVGAVLLLVNTADAQSRSARQRSNPQVISKCMHAVQEAVPGDYNDTGISRTRAAMYQSCVRNGGNIPGRRG